jgi:hypothetical protein
MADVKMKEVPVIGLIGRSVIEPSYAGPAIEGRGDVNYVCCGCGQVLLKNVAYKQVVSLTIKCGKCRKYNEIPRSHELH